jgi:hypothetical protein
MRSHPFLTLTAVLLLSLGGPADASRADFTYQVTADTSSLPGLGYATGYIDLQFNPGTVGSAPATAMIAAFSNTTGLLPLAPDSGPTGDVTGTLASGLTFGNNSGFGDFFEGFTFGSQVSFDVTLDGGVGVTAGSSFALAFYASDEATPLLSTDSSGAVVRIDLNPDGSTSVSYLADGASADLVTPSTAAPAPASLLLLASAGPVGLGFWLSRRMKGRRRAR